jgi:hypothetical protein
MLLATSEMEDDFDRRYFAALQEHYKKVGHVEFKPYKARLEG